MDAFVFFAVVVLILVLGVATSVRLHMSDTFGTGRIRRIRRMRTVRTVPGAVSAAPVDTVIEEIIDEVEPGEEEEEV